jgi:hypothetical protein
MRSRHECRFSYLLFVACIHTIAEKMLVRLERSVMKIKALSIAGVIAAMCLALFAQQPPAGGGQAPGAAGGAWAAFNYTLEEAASGQSPPIQGSGTIVYSKSGTDLKAVVIQVSINGRTIVTHTGQP